MRGSARYGRVSLLTVNCGLSIINDKITATFVRSIPQDPSEIPGVDSGDVATENARIGAIEAREFVDCKLRSINNKR